MSESLIILMLVLALSCLAWFLLGSRGRRFYIPSPTTKRAGRFVDSGWLTEKEFEELIRKQELEPPRDPERFKLWVRPGSFVIAAVSMKSGDKFFVYKASL